MAIDMIRSVVAVVVTASAVSLAACGSSSSSPQGASPSQTSAEPAPTSTSSGTSASSAAADRDVASAALLHLSDLPSGWTASDKNDGSPDSPCDQLKTARSQTSARSQAPDFAKGDDAQVSHTVYVYSDEAAARRNYVALSSQALRVCIGDYLGHEMKKEIGGKGTVGDVETSELGIDPVGEDSAAARFVIPVSAEGLDLDVNADLVIVRQGRAISFLTLFGGYSSFDEDLRTKLVATATSRLKTALAS